MDFDGDGLDGLILVVGVDAGLAVPFPGMPGADDVGAAKLALAEGSAGVGADAVEGVDGAVVVADGVGIFADEGFHEGAGRKRGEFGDFDERHT